MDCSVYCAAPGALQVLLAAILLDYIAWGVSGKVSEGIGGLQLP
jgi:hypothetical protein